MKKRHIYLVLPVVILPHFVLFALAVLFYSTRVPFCRIIIERMFQGNGLWLIASVLLFVLFSAISGAVFFFMSIRSKWEPASVARVAMILKLVHVPAYLLIFAVGILLLISVFTCPVTLALVFVDGVMLLLSGLVSVSAVINASSRQLITKNEAILLGVLSFVYVVDVISAIVFFVRLTRNHGICRVGL